MNYFHKILNNCNEVVSLSLKKEEHRLENIKDCELFIHILFCKCCKNFVKQSKKIDSALAAYFKNLEKTPPHKASEEFKNKLKTLLNTA